MTSTAPRTADRRVQRTRRTLSDALVSLLAERSWDDIGVLDICERADVGRSTFYMHFQNKEQLLAGSLGDLRALLRAQTDAEASSPSEGLTFVRGLIDHVSEQRKVFRAVVGRRSGHVVQMRFREMVLQLVAEELARFAAAGWQRDAAAHYLAGALVELLSWWVDARSRVGSDEVERYFQRLTLPMLGELKGAAG